MDVKAVISILSQRYGAGINRDYYSNIDNWVAWWRGYVKAFHSFRQQDAGGRLKTRDLATMRMAKRICEDWASVLLNEKTQLVVDDGADAMNIASLFLQGDDGTGGVLGANQFWARGNELIERAFATGTGAFVLRVKNARVAASGAIIPDHGAGVEIDYIDARGIFPITVRRGQITECAFASEVTDKGKKYLYLETHTLEGGKYVVTNEYWEADSAKHMKRAELPEGMAERVDTGSAVPWFAMIHPAIVNNVDDNNGLGLSILAENIDILKSIDIAYNNFQKDFLLGGKKVFYNKSMLQTGPNGETLAPDDVCQQLFQILGDDNNFDAKEMISEFNPSLRVEENAQGVQRQLDYLSFKCGLGTHRYQFDGTGVARTATEYVGVRQEMVQHAAKHMIVIEQALKTLCAGILYIGRAFCGLPVSENAQISVVFEDGFIVDKESERERDRQDVRDGLMLPWEYRVKWLGETEEEARAKLIERQQEMLGLASATSFRLNGGSEE